MINSRYNLDLQLVREAGKISTEILHQLTQSLRLGMTTLDIDVIAAELCRKYDVKPSFFGVGERHNRFKGSLCVSINDEILHGLPSAQQQIKEGDIVKLDFGIIYKGYFTDHCVTVAVEPVAEEDIRLVQVTKLAVESGVAKAIAGNRTGDIGAAMQTVAELSGYNVLKDYVGHGIGKQLHLSPEIPAYGRLHTGDKLQIGDVICVEAQVVAGSDATYVAEDGWTVKTIDGSKGAMFEYMVIVGDTPEVITPTRNWEFRVKLN